MGAQKLQMEIFSTSAVGRSKSGVKRQHVFPMGTHLCGCDAEKSLKETSCFDNSADCCGEPGKEKGALTLFIGLYFIFGKSCNV